MSKIFSTIVLITIAIAGYIVYASQKDVENTLEDGSSYTANVARSRPDPQIPVEVSRLP
jgi:hypothetical protein